MQTDHENASRWTLLVMLAVGLLVVFGLVSNDVDRKTAIAPDTPALLRYCPVACSRPGSRLSVCSGLAGA
jgi:hypothetical protein